MSFPAYHKALLLTEHAGPYVIRDVPAHQLDVGEVLVRVEAASIQPTDWKTRFLEEYAPFLGGYPAKQGSDAAGTVVALSEGVTNFKIGDRVFHQGAYNTKLAAFQEYTAVPAAFLAKIPDKLTTDQAASIPLALMTAAIGLYQPQAPMGGGAGLVAPWQTSGRGKYAGKAILIFGGSSSVGQFVIQLAKLSGFSTIITTVSENNKASVISLGATHTIDRKVPLSELAGAIKELTSDPIEVIYDAISSNETQNAGYDLLAPGGVISVVLLPVIDAEKQTKDKKIVFIIGGPYFPSNQIFGTELYENVTDLFASGSLKPAAVEYVPGGLAAIPEAQERVRAGAVGSRKLIIRPSEITSTA